MSKIPYVFFVSVFFLNYLTRNLEVLPQSISYAQEGLAGLVMVLVVMRMAHFKTLALGKKYLVFFAVFGVHIAIGIFANVVTTGAVVFGLRTYLRYVPFFLLPAVYNFSDRQIRNQLRFLLVLALLQSPLVVFQRFVQFGNVNTGDVISGTVGESGVLTILLVCAVALVTAHYARREIRGGLFMMLLLLLFVPTTLNETKITVFLLPVALMLPILAIGDKAAFRKLVAIGSVCLLLLVAFAAIYDRVGAGEGEGLLGFLESEKRVKSYLYTSNQNQNPLKVRGADQLPAKVKQYKDPDAAPVSRVDSLILPFKELSRDPTGLLIGLGIGNASSVPLTSFQGEYSNYFTEYGGIETSLSYILWEFGVIGATLFLLSFYLIFRDARYVAKDSSVWGTVASGWIAVVVILMGTSIIYKNTIAATALSYLFWYFSGCIAARRYHLEQSHLGHV